MRCCLLIAVLGWATVHAASLLDDPRLAPVRVELQAALHKAAQAGVPEQLLVDKVREGLAKNVPAPRLLSAVRALEASLEEAQQLASSRLHATPLPLLRAIAEARAGGASLAEVGVVLDAAHDASRATRAVSALSDLLAR